MVGENKSKEKKKISWKKGRVIGGEHRWTWTQPVFTALIDQMVEGGPFEMIVMFHDQINLEETAPTLGEAKRMIVEFIEEKLRENLLVFDAETISAQPQDKPRCDRDIIAQTNELARSIYRLHDRGGTVEEGYRFDESDHPQEQQCWRMACAAQQQLTATDPADALSALDE